MSFLGAIVTPTNLIVNVGNKVYNIQSDHPQWLRLREAYKAGDVEKFVSAFESTPTIKDLIEESPNRGVEIKDGQVLYNGEPVHNSVVDAIQRMAAEGFDINPMVKFLENLMECVSYNSVKEMWKFIEAMGLTVTEDGCFLAYKSVRQDYRDKYSGRIDNTPGQKPKRMKRSQVDDNPHNHCSNGYHVGALEYAGPNGWYHGHGDRVIICKINPQDVVSVPNDHSFQKLRCCYYEPVGEFEGRLEASCYSGEVGGDYSPTASPHRRFRSEVVLDEYGLLEDNFYIGLYTKEDGTTARRFFLVEEVNANDSYTVSLVEPEENAGGVRTFKMARLNEVCTWDGKTDPDTLDNPWVDYDPYDEEEDEPEVCDYCGDYLDNCGGYCEDDEDEDDDDIGYTGRRTYW